MWGDKIVPISEKLKSILFCHKNSHRHLEIRSLNICLVKEQSFYLNSSKQTKFNQYFDKVYLWRIAKQQNPIVSFLLIIFY